MQEVSWAATVRFAAYQVIAAREGSSNSARYDGVHGYRSQVAPDSMAKFSNTRAESFGQTAPHYIRAYALSAAA